MNLETKFDLHQQVWTISNANCGHGHITTECSICNRTGKVVIKGEELRCPKCNGASVPPEWSIEVNGGIIVQVDAVRTVSKVARSEGWDNRNTYRIGHIGDGRIWHEDELFASEQEAEAECVERNVRERQTAGL